MIVELNEDEIKKACEEYIQNFYSLVPEEDSISIDWDEDIITVNIKVKQQ